MKKIEEFPLQKEPEEKGVDVIKEEITRGLDIIEKEAEEGKIGDWRVNTILGLLREDGPLVDDPDREELLEKLKDLAPEQMAKIEAHNEEVRARDKERKEGKENPIKQKVLEEISGLEKGKPVSKLDLDRLVSLLREDGPLADDADREKLLNRIQALEQKE